MKKINNIIFSIFIIMLTGIYLSGCQQNITNSSDIVFPDKNISYLSSVKPFLQITCAYVGCHDSQSQAGGINISDYFYMFQTPGLIVSGNPDGSILVQMLEDKLPHSPLVYWKVNDNQKKGIRQWILEGAKNN